MGGTAAILGVVVFTTMPQNSRRRLGRVRDPNRGNVPVEVKFSGDFLKKSEWHNAHGRDFQELCFKEFLEGECHIISDLDWNPNEYMGRLYVSIQEPNQPSGDMSPVLGVSFSHVNVIGERLVVQTHCPSGCKCRAYIEYEEGSAEVKGISDDIMKRIKLVCDYNRIA